MAKAPAEHAATLQLFARDAGQFANMLLEATWTRVCGGEPSCWDRLW